jgi:isocitrate dehydrogenase kinase/phosphatase
VGTGAAAFRPPGGRLIDRELYKTFYNTLSRRFFQTRGVDAAIEFIAMDVEPTDAITHPVARTPMRCRRSD